MVNKNLKKYFLFGLILILVLLFFQFDLGRFLTLEYIKNSQVSFSNFYNQNSILVILLFFLIYILVTALSLPGAAILTLAAGAIFGFFLGVLIVSFASSIGATLAAFFSRYLFADFVEKKFGSKLKSINDGIKKEGSFYLFTLRLIPIFPFFLINLLMGLTKFPLKKFYFISQIGMLLGTMVYVNAGVQLSKITSLSGILSFNLLVSFALLGLFPIIIKKLLNFYKSKRNNLGKNNK